MVFTIIESTSHGSYIVQRLNKPEIPKVKFMTKYLYILPSSFITGVPVDGSNKWYLNFPHSSIYVPIQNR